MDTGCYYKLSLLAAIMLEPNIHSLCVTTKISALQHKNLLLEQQHGFSNMIAGYDD